MIRAHVVREKSIRNVVAEIKSQKVYFILWVWKERDNVPMNDRIHDTIGKSKRMKIVLSCLDNNKEMMM